MRTPAGLECRYFYGDYYRGRNHEECRLILDSTSSHPWTRDLCKTCPVPGIIAANSCPNMVLSGEVKRTWLGLVRRVQIRAFCTQNNSPVSEPHIGCGKCHPLPPIFESNQK